MPDDDDFDRPRRQRRRRADDDDYQRQRSDPHVRVRGPGQGLYAVGLLCTVLCLLVMILMSWAVLFDTPPRDDKQEVIIVVMAFIISIGGVAVTLCGLVAWGGRCMMRCRNYGLAMTAAILAIASMSLLLLPFGIWAIIVLSDVDVKRAFRQSAVQHDSGTDRD